MTKSLSDQFEIILFDLDGVIYIGSSPVPYAADAVSSVGSKAAYITNNASRTAQMVADTLSTVGVQADEEQIVTSAQIAADVLLEEFGTSARIFVVGGVGLREEIARRGMTLVDDHMVNPDAVAQGFAPELTWKDFANATIAIERGSKWLATNLDFTIPVEGGIAPGNGSLVSMIGQVVGQEPPAVGKPAPTMIHAAMNRTKATTGLVVGDRLDTDIEAGNRAGLPTLLVLTGVTSISDLIDAPKKHRPTYISPDLRILQSTEPIPAMVEAMKLLNDAWSGSEAVDSELEIKLTSLVKDAEDQLHQGSKSK